MSDECTEAERLEHQPEQVVALDLRIRQPDSDFNRPVKEHGTVPCRELAAFQNQLKHQQEMILKLPEQSNNFVKNSIDIPHVTPQTLLDERQQTKNDNDRIAEVSAQPQTEVIRMKTVKRLPLRDFGQIEEVRQIESVQSLNERLHLCDFDQTQKALKTENVRRSEQLLSEECIETTTRSEDDVHLEVEQHYESEGIMSSPHPTLFCQENSVETKQASFVLENEGDAKPNLESVSATPKTLKNSRKSSFSASRSFSCIKCNKRFNTKSNLTTHLRIHTGERPFKCNNCDAAFRNSHHLKAHQRIHIGGRSFKCGVCDASFSRKDQFIVHRRIHTGERPFKCKNCDASFRNSHHLKTHQRIHTGVRPFQCGNCDAAFNVKQNLATHLRIHANDGPFKCSYCNAVFSRANSLTTHQRIHTGVRPFKCGACGEAFSRRNYLTTHQRIHTEQNAAQDFRMA